METRFYAVNAHGRQRLEVKTLGEAVLFCRMSPYFQDNPPKKIIIETRQEVVWNT